MNLEGKLAKLQAGNEHMGTAWLIDSQHAITALHCVQREDETMRSHITLKFHGINNSIKVSVLNSAPGLDIALLRIEQSDEDLTSRVVPLSRGNCEFKSECRMYGYPEQVIGSHPHGISVACLVSDPAHLYKGPNDKLTCETIQLGCIEVSPNFNGSTGLQGISGGVLVLDNKDENTAALAVILGEYLSGTFVYAVSCKVIADCFPIVKEALIGSPHVNRSDTKIYVEFLGAQTIRWAAPFKLESAGELWSSTVDRLKLTSLHCAGSLREFKAASKALLRFAAYSSIEEIHVPDEEQWRMRLDGLKQHVRSPVYTAKVLSGAGATLKAQDIFPSQWHSMLVDEFAQTLHDALNKALLTQLDKELYACLDGGKDTEIGCEIESVLRQKMWTEWEAWKPVLEEDYALLRRFLARVFSIDAAGDDNDEILMTIGCCSAVHEQLFRATLFALALSAAGVDTVPAIHDYGNFTVEEETAHACGLETKDRRRIDLVVETVDWKTAVVILPHLQAGLMELFEKSISMTKADGSASRGLQRTPPIAITADRIFLYALQRGASHVAEYYKDRVREIRSIQQTMRVYSRTEELDA